jgi:hypothetical protein
MVMSDQRIYPGLSSPMQLFRSNFTQMGEQIRQATPLLRPSGYERVLLDPNYEDVWEVGLPVECPHLGSVAPRSIT